MKESPIKIIYYLNKLALFTFTTIKWKRLHNLKDIFFSLIEKKFGKGTNSSYPVLIEKWLKNQLSSLTILSELDNILENDLSLDNNVKCLLKDLSHTLFQPCNFTNIMTPCSGIELLKMIPNDIPVYLITNLDSESFDLIYEKYKTIFSRFDDIIVSGKVFMMKPQKDIYQLAIQKWNLKPSHVLYIDDEEDNINTAESLGFQTIHFGSFVDAFAEVQEYLSLFVNSTHFDNSDTDTTCFLPSSIDAELVHNK